MAEPPVDLAEPPDEPPPGVALPMLWRVAARLRHDHGELIRGRWGPPTCARCGQGWPCFGRRLALRGLLAAARRPGRDGSDGSDGP